MQAVLDMFVGEGEKSNTCPIKLRIWETKHIIVHFHVRLFLCVLMFLLVDKKAKSAR